MKTKVPGLLVVLLFAGIACSVPRYVPEVAEIGSSPYGSYIKLKLRDRGKLKGELIAVDEDRLLVLTDATSAPVVEQVKKEDIKSFLLYFADAPDVYPWLIPASAALSFSHGIFAMLSAPLNILITTSIAVNAQKDFRYSEDHITVDQLYMFARFPQGLPPNVQLNEIR